MTVCEVTDQSIEVSVTLSVVVNISKTVKSNHLPIGLTNENHVYIYIYIYI